MKKGFDKKGIVRFAILSIILFIFLLTFTSAATKTCYSCVNCTAEIGNASPGDIVQLNNSIINIGGSCINITSKTDIIFDCRNFSNSIAGDLSGNDYGINITSSNNNTLINCNVSKFYYGLLSRDSNNFTINSSLFDFNHFGVYLYNSSSNKIENISGSYSYVGTFYLSQLTKNNSWETKYSHNFQVDYSTQKFKFEKVNGKIILRITQENLPFADIEQIKLESCIGEIQPKYAIYTEDNKDILNDIKKIDNNVVIAHNKTIEISWNIPFFCIGKQIVSLTANEYNHAFPFRFPEMSGWINYSNAKTGSIKLDGIITEEDSLKNYLFNPYWNPDTGHPAGFTYLYIKDDEENVYFSADVTIDNTNDFGEDWTKVLIETKNGKKEFRIDDYNKKYGTCGFGLTDKVDYKHQTCEFKIPKKEIELDKFNFAFYYYGTSGSSGGVGLTLNTNSSRNIVKDSLFNSNGIGVSILSESIHNNFTNIISIGNANSGATGYSYGVYCLFNSLGNFFDSLTLKNNTYGFYLDGANNTIKNSIIINNSRGIDLAEGTSYNIITNVTLINNSEIGVYVMSSSNHILVNNTISGSERGILLYQNFFNVINETSITNCSIGIEVRSDTDGSSGNNTLTNLNLSENSFVGIYLSQSHNNTIKNCISNNNKYGVIIVGSRNVISNITAKNNSLYGIFLQTSSYNNTIKDSFIQLNEDSAFSLNNTGTSPKNNYFYNNYFNNSVAFSNISTSSLNYFNTTKTLGTNIIGGSYLAGNYWAAPNGSGFSQTCPDADDDGICDTSYSLDGINYDYLPLGGCDEEWSCSWGNCINNLETYTCVDSNLCQTYLLKPSDDGTTRDCGSVGTPPVKASGGGGGGSSVSKPLNITTPEEQIEILINNSNMDLNSISLNLKKEIVNGSIVITKLNETSELKTGLPIGRLYQVFEVKIPEIDNSGIINATFNFKINKTWLIENNITIHFNEERYWLVEEGIVGNIKLYRNPNGNKEWVSLEANFSKEDEAFYYFSSYSPGFSTFAIFFNKYDCLPNSARCSENKVQLCLGNSTWLVTETCSDVCKNGKCEELFFKSNEFFILLVTVISGIIVIVLIIFFNKMKKVYKPYSWKK
jgi:PGF-pre-PGF domain-containing protein